MWKRIPDDADIVMTHGPAKGILDQILVGSHVGDSELRRELLERVKPKFHCCGHIHEAFGAEVVDGTTRYVVDLPTLYWNTVLFLYCNVFINEVYSPIYSFRYNFHQRRELHTPVPGQAPGRGI